MPFAVAVNQVAGQHLHFADHHRQVHVDHLVAAVRRCHPRRDVLNSNGPPPPCRARRRRPARPQCALTTAGPTSTMTMKAPGPPYVGLPAEYNNRIPPRN